MAVENHSIGDGKVSINEAKRLLREAVELQKVLAEIKLHAEETGSRVGNVPSIADGYPIRLTQEIFEQNSARLESSYPALHMSRTFSDLRCALTYFNSCYGAAPQCER